MRTKNLVRLLGLVLAAVLVATSLQVLPRVVPPAAAEDLAPPALPAPEPEPDLPLGQAPTEPRTGFVEGVSVEDRRLWTEGSRTWRNPDNTLTTRSYGGAVNFRDPAGLWQGIDSTIVADEAGGFRVAAAPYSVRFGLTSSSPELMSFTAGASSVSFAPPLGATAGVVPVVEGNKITYPSILPGVDLRYVVGRFMVKEDLILAAPPAAGAAPLFQFPITTTNASLSARPDGGFDLAAPDGSKVFTIPAGFMTDADPGTWAPDRHGPVSLSLRDVAGGKVLSVAPDLEWLVDPTRQYPVYVDPTIQTHGNTCFWHGCQGVSVDAFVYQGWPDWNGNQNWVGPLGRWTDDVGGEDGPYERVSYLHYDAKVFTYSNINWGHWQGYWTWKQCPGATEYWMWPTGGAWDNGSGAPDGWMPDITWNRRIYNGDAWTIGDAGVIHVATDAPQWNRWDITGWVANWASTAWANRGVQIDTRGSGNCRFRALAAHENGDGSDSYLEVDHWDPSPNVPSLSSPGHGANLTTTPQLAAVYSDPNGEPGYVRFNVYRRSDNALVAGGSVGTVCSGCTAYWTPPALGDGNYWWNAYGYDDTSRGGDSGGWWFNVDGTAPAAPSISSSTHPDQNVWYANNAPSFTWSAGDTSGICDYAYSLTSGSAADPGTASRGTGTSYNSSALADGAWYFNVRAKNCSGLWGAYSSYRARIDAGGPAAPVVDSSTHPTPDGWYTSRRPAFSWTASDASGICDYSYVFDQASGTDPGTTTNANKGTGLGWTKPDDAPEGDSWVHIRAKNCANVWGAIAHRRVRIDASAPPAPAVSSSTHPSQDAWSTNNTPAFSWTAADLSGIDGYSRDLNQTQAHTPDETSEGTAASWASTAVGDGEHWFHVRARNGAGTWGTPDAGVGHYRVRVDATKPADLAAWSPSHGDPARWYADNTPAFQWSASDTSGIVDYSYVLDQLAGTDPGTTTNANKGTATDWTSTAVADGEHWFHIRARNGAGTWSDPVHVKVQVEAAQPSVPKVESPSHPSSTTWYADATADFRFSATAVSGIAGFSYDINSTPVMDPDQVSDGNTGTYSAPAVAADGVWYFHVRAQNAAGTWGPSAHYEFRVDTTRPSAPVLVTSTSHAPNFASSNSTIEVTWEGATDVPSGVASFDWEFTDSALPPAVYTHNTPDSTGPESATSPVQPEGERWFHVRTVDRAGNVSDDRAYGPFFVDPDAPGDPVVLASTLLPNLVAQSDELGLEQWAPYRQVPLGGSGTGYVQLRTGNLVASFDDASIPGVGLNTVIRHTYNARRSDATQHDNGLGLGWTLSVSDLEAGLEDVEGAIEDIDVSAPITVAAPRVIEGVFTSTGYMVEFTDGDGTTHRFMRDGGKNSRWSSPPGVSLRIREEYANATDPLPFAYELIRPDGVVYRAERTDTALALDPWRIVSVTDRRGNAIVYGYELVANKVRLARVDSSRPGVGRLVDLSYDPTTARLSRITTLPTVTEVADPATGTARSWARTVDFAYTAGRLTSVTENAHTTAAGGRRTTTLAYDPATGRLSGITDPRAKTTAVAYLDTPEGPRVQAVTDRRGHPWGFAYGPSAANGDQDSTVSPPAPSRPTVYRTSGRGPIGDGDRRIAGGNLRTVTDAGTDAGAVVTSYGWVDNRLTTAADAAGAATRFRYNDLGLLTEVTEPAPNDPTTPGLPAAAATAEVISRLDYHFPAGPDGAYRAPECSDQAPGTREVSRDGWCHAVGEATRTTFADNYGPAVRRISDFAYDRGDGLLTGVTQRADGSGGATAADRTTTFAYYSRGGLRSIDGPRADVGDVTTFGDTSDATYGGYHRSGQPTRITDALARTKTFDYTPYGLVARVADRDGRVTRTRYDERDNPVEVTDPQGDTSSFGYDANDWRTTETTARGKLTTTDYNDAGQVTAVTRPGGTVTRSTYNPDGTKASDVNPLGGVTEYSYWPNAALRLTKAPTAASVGVKSETEHLYDNLGRLRTTRSPVANAAGDRPTETLAYTPDGKVQVRSETSPLVGQSAETLTIYNAHNEVVEARGPRTNAAGERATETTTVNSFGEVTLGRRLLDGGRWVDSRTDYDAAGNRTLTTQATGLPGEAVRELITNYTFDPLGQITTQTDPVNPGHISAFAYTGEGQQAERADFRGYDPAQHTGGLNEALLTRVRTTTTRFNADNTPAESVSTDNVSGDTLATCNSAQPAAGAAPDPGTGYDPDGNLLVTRTVRGTGGCAAGGVTLREQSFVYDDRGWATSTTQKVRSPETGAMVSRTQSFAHTADGNWDTATHDGRTVDYTYSDAGWLESMLDWKGRVSTHAFFASGAPRTTTFGGPTVATASFAYNGDGSMASLQWKAGAAQGVVRSHTAIGYDVGGLRRAETVQLAQPVGSAASSTPGTATFDYDLLDRLSAWTSPFAGGGGQPSTTYTLDDGGNSRREDVLVGGELRSRTVNTYANGRLEGRSAETFAPVTETTYSQFVYTDLGEERWRLENQTVAGVPAQIETVTGYDPAGHAKEVTEWVDGVGTKIIRYVYDTADRLISRTETIRGVVGPTSLYFYWGSSGNLAEETDGAGNPKVRYLPDEDGEPIAQEKPGALAETTTWTWLLPDTNGNVATHVDDAGTVVEQAAYDPYGKKDKGGSSKGDGQASGSSLGFQGALTDPTTGSVVLGARQYDPGIGRFLTPDTFVASALDVSLGTDDLTGNRYLFAAANPVAFYEDGHWPSMPKFVKKLAKRALPALSFVPVVGTAIDVVSAATGRDWLNGGKKLSGAERALMLAGAAAGMVPGAGTAVKAGLKVAAKAATKSRTAAKAASAVASHGDEAAEMAGMACKVNSFVPGTRVLMADGTTKPIEDVDIGDLVVATDPETGETEAKPVTDLIEGTGLKHLVDLTINGYIVTATGGHPFWVDGRGWVNAEQVRPGDFVLEADGDLESVQSASAQKMAYATVHNLTVAGLHTYYVEVGEPVLVHNCALPYNEARKLTRGLGGKLQAHHIVESRHLRSLKRGDEIYTGPSIVLGRAEHQIITNDIRRVLPYARNYSVREMRAGYRKAYASRPDLYAVVRQTVRRQQ